MTDYGYAVGEAEIVVQDTNDIEQASQQIDEFLTTLLPPTDDEKKKLDTKTPASAIGKLEYYIQKNRPQLFNILVEAGLMKLRN
jgi:hypothetical protein